MFEDYYFSFMFEQCADAKFKGTMMKKSIEKNCN